MEEGKDETFSGRVEDEIQGEIVLVRDKLVGVAGEDSGKV
jgi:hypothetical protein